MKPVPCPCTDAQILAWRTGMKIRCMVCGHTRRPPLAPPKPLVNTDPQTSVCYCTEAIAAVKTSGVNQTCDVCGITLYLREGSVTRKLGDIKRDLDLLARYFMALAGRAASVEPTIPSGASQNGRPDFVDENHFEMSDAIRVMQRLATLKDRDIVVLVMCFLLNGPNSRADWKGKSFEDGFDARVGFVFAQKHTKQRIAQNRIVSASHDRMAKFGGRLKRMAVQAYASAVNDPPPTNGQWLSVAIDSVTQRVIEADTVLHESASGDRKNRAVSNGKKLNRKARREPLQKKVAKVAKVANPANQENCANIKSA